MAVLGSDNITHSTDFKFNINSGDRITIDSSGRLLVGTSTARSGFFSGNVSTALQIEGGATSTCSFSITRNAADADSSKLVLAHARGTANQILTNNDAIGEISWQGADGAKLLQAASITAIVNGTPGTDDMPGALLFSTTADGASSPTERMRITNAGMTRIFDSSQSGLRVQSASAAGTTNSVFSGSHSAISTTSEGTQSIAIRTNGNIVNINNSYGSLSDAKLKENIVNAGSQWEDFKAMQVRKYNFKEETGQQTHTQIGLIAQEVELVSPGLVSESPDRDEEGNDLGTVTKSVNYSVLYMKAVKALQEAMERIETLEAKVAALEAS